MAGTLEETIVDYDKRQLMEARRLTDLFRVIDTLYSYTYMDESTYRELMKRARTDLATAVEKRRRLLATLEATEKEIAQLKRLVGGIYAYADRIDEHNELCSGEGLKDAIRTALRATSEDVTISEILGILKDLQFPIERHQNPLGSVYTTVTRLMTEGEVVAGEFKGEKKTYRWAQAQPKPDPFPGGLPGIGPLVRLGETIATSLKTPRKRRTEGANS